MPDATCPRLIEVALPIREISAESVRDKSLRCGHICTLHLWWARRPLATARAIVFASLVPDPDHPNCPAEFRKLVLKLLKSHVPELLQGYRRGRIHKKDTDPYHPYDGIPDTPRNRLLTFIAKWSPEWLEFEKGKTEESPPPKEMLDDRSLVKWETSDPENEQGRAVLRLARELVFAANDGKVPTVLDPFAGGGAIPLEATRLGCQAIANDYNPVAYLILRATCEFPQKYGKPGTRKDKFGRQVQVPNVLAYDVEHWAKWILERAKERIGKFYPAGKDGKAIAGYLWARTAPCSNPACRAEVPLLSSLLVVSNGQKRVALTMTRSDGGVSFGISRDRAIKETDGTMLNRGDCRCPICKQVTPVEDLRRAGLEGKIGERMVGVITDTPQGKSYRPVERTDHEAFDLARQFAENVERPREPILPEITGEDAEDTSNSTGIRVHLYGVRSWGSLFNPRQLVALQTLVGCLREALRGLEQGGLEREYRRAVFAYLGLWVSKESMFLTSFGKLHTKGETLDSPFSMQKISMAWNYPEVNPFSEVTGGAVGQLEWVVRVINHEAAPEGTGAYPSLVHCGDGADVGECGHLAEAVVTDPPYFDAISFADLSDFFYVWLKRGLGDQFPEAFVTPLTPKGGEATALKHRHKGSAEKARLHFTSKLAACLAEGRRLCTRGGVMAVMFAHQSTEAWVALINSLFEAGLTSTATYPIETEMKNRSRGLDSSALESSITVVCRPREAGTAAPLRDVRREIDGAVAESVRRFWDYGFRGADLVVACYGPAVGVFGRYERVERADGKAVGVPELLGIARESALKAIAGEFTGDALSRLYFVWANLYGTGEQAWDDARLVVMVGGGSEDAMEVARRRGLFVLDGSRCRLALLRDRADLRHLGEEESAPLINQLHHAMGLWQEEKRPELVAFLRDRGLTDHAPFWKLAQALFDVLPRDEGDWKLLSALLGERDTLRIETGRREARPFGPLFNGHGKE